MVCITFLSIEFISVFLKLSKTLLPMCNYLNLNQCYIFHYIHNHLWTIVFIYMLFNLFFSSHRNFPPFRFWFDLDFSPSNLHLQLHKHVLKVFTFDSLNLVTMLNTFTVTFYVLFGTHTFFHISVTTFIK